MIQTYHRNTTDLSDFTFTRGYLPYIMHAQSMYHSRAPSYIRHLYPQRSSDLDILYLQAWDISQCTCSPISFSANALLSFTKLLMWIISALALVPMSVRQIPAHLLLRNYSGSNTDTKGTCTSHTLLHNADTVINVRKQSPVKPYTRTLQSWFKVIILLSLSCNMLYGQEKVNYCHRA